MLVTQTGKPQGVVAFHLHWDLGLMHHFGAVSCLTSDGNELDVVQ